MNEREARLRQFFSGCFNQDWDATGAKSWTDVVTQYVKENPRAQVQAIRNDLRSWLADGTSSARALPASLGCDYDPLTDGVGVDDWVRQLAAFMDRQLSN